MKPLLLWFGFNDLQSGPDGICGGMPSARDRPVDLTGIEHHRSKHGVVLKLARCHSHGETFIFSQFKKPVDISWPQLRRIQNFQIMRQLNILASRHLANLCRIAEKHAAGYTAPGADCGCLTVRGSTPSGKTILFLAARAFSVSW